MSWLLLFPFLAQGFLMTVDEFHFHRLRGLGRWERLGHPVDTLGLLLPFCVAAWPGSPTFPRIVLFAALAALSCVLITKDEWVHARECLPMEQWLHSLLFVLHPCALLSAAAQAYLRFRSALLAECGVLLLWMGYQLVYWNLIRDENGERAPG